MRLILASASARRRELLAAAGLPFHQEAADTDERRMPGELPEAYVARVEQELIHQSLARTRGNKRQAARLLNLSRTTFIDKLQRLNVEGAAAAAAQSA